MQTDLDVTSAPGQALPALAQLVLTRWRGLCSDSAPRLPDLHDLAPAMVPPPVLPWSMTYRRDPERRLSYGVVGEELTFLFHGNPRGKTVLDYAAPEIRAARYAIIHRALDDGLPVWYTARLLFESGSADLGRLCLPARIDSGEVLLLLYFPLTPFPDMPERRRRLGEERGDTSWLSRRPD